jgi:adenylate kinase
MLHSAQLHHPHTGGRFTKRVMLLGAPGVGKGTYASRAAKVLNIPHVAAGDIIRSEIKSQSPLGKQMSMYTQSGRLVPDELINDLIVSHLRQYEALGFLLDGFPRNLTQARSTNLQLDSVINLVQSEDVIIRKISGRRVCSNCGTNYNVEYIKEGELDMPPILPKKEGICDVCGSKDSLIQRPDDNKEVVKRRLLEYKNETEPLVNYYENLGILRIFRVTGGAEELLPKFLELLHSD